MKWTRTEYLDLLLGVNTKKQMLVELFGPLLPVEAEWRNQGASVEEINMSAFEFDYMDCVRLGNTDIFGGQKPIILDETEEYVISRDELGRKNKMIKTTATIPIPLDYPVKTMDDWLKIKHLYTFNEKRINWTDVELAIKKQKAGTLVLSSIPGGFDLPRQLMGEENVCFCYYDEPELMHDILNTAGETAVKVLERITDKIQIDVLHVHEDMAGKSGPLVGASIIDEFINPYYRKAWDLVSSRGTKVFSQDSDGNMTAIIEAFMRAGINQMYPMEPAAGMDIVEVRKKYGKDLILKGGIDKHVLRASKNDILRELEYKMQPLMQEGGVVFGLDHRIPNGTPLENYRYYVNTAKEILGLPAITGKNKSWARMAF